ncbi:MAG: hypothetical protein H7A25_08185 [Leptospiraceae bacterium]|nr:hypothetical protein [Leptospiraceae bacterium]MCP5499865.1 hypothetical protein [Leptospiraceae bacterium]
MKELQEFIEKELKLPFEIFRLPPLLFEIEKGYPLLLGNAFAVDRVYLAQGEIEEYLFEAPEGYLLAGYWGHGVNSTAFYYCRVTDWSRIFLRLPYGGIYQTDEDVDFLRSYLLAFFQFMKTLEKQDVMFTAVEAMYEGKYILKNGIRELQFGDSLFLEPNFNGIFSELL